MSKRIITLLSILVLFLGCSENIIEPVLEPGKRDYIWSVDTIFSFNPLYRIWGSSPNDVWTITVGSWDEDVYHFDGRNWTTDGVFRIWSPHAIWGFSKNNIFIGSGGGKIWHYNGDDWQETAKLTKDGHSDIAFNNMWGESPNKLYAFGAYSDDDGLLNKSIIAYYNGSSWKMVNTDGLEGIVASLFKNKPDNAYYMQLIKWSNTYDSTYIYQYKNEKYSMIYKTIWSNTWASISLINNVVYFILKKEISIRENNQFETVLNLENYDFYQRIWGRHSEDIFVLMTDGLAHYNGIDIDYLFYFPNPRTQIWGAVLFKNEVFMLTYEASTGLSLIYHGKLPN